MWHIYGAFQRVPVYVGDLSTFKKGDGVPFKLYCMCLYHLQVLY